MADRTLSTSVDETVARFVDDIVRTEGRTPSQILSAALNLYLQLPEAAHRAFGVVESLGTEDERLRTKREMVRALLNGEYEVTKRQAASRLPVANASQDEDDLMEEAVRMVKAPR